MPANSLILAALCALPLSAPPVSPVLSIGFVGADVEFRVEHGNQIFLGGIIASLSPEMTHYLTGLPPLLSSYVVLGAGVGYPDGGFAVQLTQSQLPPGVEVFAQGVTLTEGIQSSDVGSFTLAVVMPTGSSN
ncbi:MAG: hypothetical protein ACI89X_000619 [Planctomycetota bacterium]|jgi:hypothetical protein